MELKCAAELVDLISASQHSMFLDGLFSSGNHLDLDLTQIRDTHEVFTSQILRSNNIE